MITWIVNNWYWIVAIAAVLFLVLFSVAAFLKLPTSTQIAALKEWLKYAVTIAEKELGGGTGQLKLRMVYDMFVQKFTWLASYISFETFSGYVDEALEWMKSQLSTNTAVSALVSGTAAGMVSENGNMCLVGSITETASDTESTSAAETETDPYADWIFTEEELAKHTVTELKAYASDAGIEIPGKTTKANIIQMILNGKGD